MLHPGDLPLLAICPDGLITGVTLARAIGANEVIVVIGHRLLGSTFFLWLFFCRVLAFVTNTTIERPSRKACFFHIALDELPTALHGPFSVDLFSRETGLIKGSFSFSFARLDLPRFSPLETPTTDGNSAGLIASRGLVLAIHTVADASCLF